MAGRRVLRRNARGGNDDDLTPAMREAIANQVATVLENSLPNLLEGFFATERERTRKALEDHNNARNVVPPRRCDYKTFKACGPPLTMARGARNRSIGGFERWKRSFG
jgi:hypothetical protein